MSKIDWESCLKYVKIVFTEKIRPELEKQSQFREHITTNPFAEVPPPISFQFMGLAVVAFVLSTPPRVEISVEADNFNLDSAESIKLEKLAELVARLSQVSGLKAYAKEGGYSSNTHNTSLNYPLKPDYQSFTIKK